VVKLAAPHPITGVPSCELILGKPVHSKLHDLHLKTSDILDEGIKDRDMWQKYLGKSYTDKKRWSLPIAASPGERCLCETKDKTSYQENFTQNQ
jgi:hypothetical protein